MSIQRYLTKAGSVRYRARVKSHGREVTTRVFPRKVDAVAWEQDQSRRLRTGEWFDPRRGRVPLRQVGEEWLAGRTSVKQRTAESDAGAWRLYIEPQWGHRPVSSMTAAEVSNWIGTLMKRGLAASTVTRALSTLRLILGHAVADGRIVVNVAMLVKAPSRSAARREGQALTVGELDQLFEGCAGPYADLVLVLGMEGLRWGEVAGLQVGDLIAVPGRGLRVRRAVLASRGGGALYVDSVKNQRARTVPLVAEVVPIIDQWAAGRAAADWLFPAPKGGPLSESNWKRSVGWKAAITAMGRPTLRVHDLRHTTASVWLGHGADPKVVQRVLGHATAAMTMDLYGHLVDTNLWAAAAKLGGISGARRPAGTQTTRVEDERNTP